MSMFTLGVYSVCVCEMFVSCSTDVAVCLNGTATYCPLHHGLAVSCEKVQGVCSYHPSEYPSMDLAEVVQILDIANSRGH